jgi:hypothetical protein
MNRRHLIFKSSLLVLLFLAPTISRAQGTTADYDRAFAMRNKYQGLGINIAERPSWIDQTSRFWYRKAVKGGNEFVLVNAETLVKKPAFDHEKLAAALSTASSQKLTALTLPFTSISFVYSERGVQFVAFGSTWRCDISDYSCKKTGTAPAGLPGRPPADDPPSEFENDVVEAFQTSLLNRANVARVQRSAQVPIRKKLRLTANGKQSYRTLMCSFVRKASAKAWL